MVLSHLPGRHAAVLLTGENSWQEEEGDDGPPYPGEPSSFPGLWLTDPAGNRGDAGD